MFRCLILVWRCFRIDSNLLLILDIEGRFLEDLEAYNLIFMNGYEIGEKKFKIDENIFILNG